MSNQHYIAIDPGAVLPDEIVQRKIGQAPLVASK
jgi:hypothetical protein